MVWSEERKLVFRSREMLSQRTLAVAVGQQQQPLMNLDEQQQLPLLGGVQTVQRLSSLLHLIKIEVQNISRQLQAWRLWGDVHKSSGKRS